MATHPWFEIEEPGEGDDPENFWCFSEAERAYLEVLQACTTGLSTSGVSGFVGRPDDESALLACLALSDDGGQLISFGAHVAGDVVRGDRLHNQLYSLPAVPSSWAFQASGDVGQLGRLTAEWMSFVLSRPVLLYQWLHDGRAYAVRYLFGDTNETLSQRWDARLAPPGKADELAAAGYVHGRGWIQTTGLGMPDFFVHVRGDLSTAEVPRGVPESKQRRAVAGVIYE